jgi:hypothetical protein
MRPRLGTLDAQAAAGLREQDLASHAPQRSVEELAALLPHNQFLRNRLAEMQAAERATAEAE